MCLCPVVTSARRHMREVFRSNFAFLVGFHLWLETYDVDVAAGLGASSPRKQNRTRLAFFAKQFRTSIVSHQFSAKKRQMWNEFCCRRESRNQVITALMRDAQTATQNDDVRGTKHGSNALAGPPPPPTTTTTEQKQYRQCLCEGVAGRRPAMFSRKAG